MSIILKSIYMQYLITFLKKVFRARHWLKIIIGHFVTIDRGKISECSTASKLFSFAGGESVLLPEVEFVSNSKPETKKFTIEVKFPRIDVYLFANARLVSPRATTLTQYRKIITEHTGGSKATMLSSQKSLQPFSILAKSFYPAVKKDGTFFSINSPYAFNYYHWFTDCLVQLQIFEQYSLNSEFLILPNGMGSWQIRSLELLGYYSNDYKTYQYEHLQVKELIVPTYHKPEIPYMPPSASSLFWLRDRMLMNLSAKDKGFYEKVFISRADSNKKRINNEAEIGSKLEKIGFKVIILSMLSLDEQIRIFCNAKVIIATHGAGLTNLLFSYKPIVIEIFPRDCFLPFYYAITEILEGCYFAYSADYEDENGDSIVDCNLFLKVVRKHAEIT